MTMLSLYICSIESLHCYDGTYTDDVGFTTEISSNDNNSSECQVKKIIKCIHTALLFFVNQKARLKKLNC